MVGINIYLLLIFFEINFMSIFNVFLKIVFILFGMLYKNVILWIVKILLKYNFVV